MQAAVHAGHLPCIASAMLASAFGMAFLAIAFSDDPASCARRAAPRANTGVRSTKVLQ